ncbi:MAG TPA: hypothetical protein VGJ86_10335 [Acidimicrobiales bacterium]
MNAAFFLLLAVGISVVGCLVLYWRQRPPRSTESGIDSFRREMEALASRGQGSGRRRRLWKR